MIPDQLKFDIFLLCDGKKLGKPVPLDLTNTGAYCVPSLPRVCGTSHTLCSVTDVPMWRPSRGSYPEPIILKSESKKRRQLAWRILLQNRFLSSQVLLKGFPTSSGPVHLCEGNNFRGLRERACLELGLMADSILEWVESVLSWSPVCIPRPSVELSSTVCCPPPSLFPCFLIPTGALRGASFLKSSMDLKREAVVSHLHVHPHSHPAQ